MADAPITHRRIFAIALPIVISNATIPILGAVDTGVVGQLGTPEPIGAVGIGAVILAALYWIMGFLRMGTTGLAAQARGAGEQGEVIALLMRALLIGFGAGALFILLHPLVFSGAFHISPASDTVEDLARDYMSIRIWGAPAVIALYGVTGWLIAAERTRAVLLLQLWMNGLNIALDVYFVWELDFGVQGVAAATLIAEWSGLALGLWLCRGAFSGAYWRDKSALFDRARLRHMMAVNGDIVLRSLMLQSVMVSLVFLGARFGDVALAANQILLQFLEITAYALDGFAFAAEALVGQAVGAQSRAHLRLATLRSTQWGVAVSLLLAVVFTGWGGALIDLMTTASDIRVTAREYLIYVVIAPMAGIVAWMLDGVFIGATRTRDMRNMMAVSVAIYLVALLVLLPAFGNHGLWAALLVCLLARGATLWWRYPALEAAVTAPKMAIK